MRVETFVDDLKKKLGLDGVLRVAKRNMDNTNPNNWVNIPKGTVFFNNDKKTSNGLNEKYLKNLHNYWTHVYHVVKKRMK